MTSVSTKSTDQDVLGERRFQSSIDHEMVDYRPTEVVSLSGKPLFHFTILGKGKFRNGSDSVRDPRVKINI